MNVRIKFEKLSKVLESSIEQLAIVLSIDVEAKTLWRKNSRVKSHSMHETRKLRECLNFREASNRS